MQKDFDGWNLEKQFLHAESPTRFCHSREIWWCALGVNVGFEEDGKGRYFERPIIIVKSFGRSTAFGAALTGHAREDGYHFPIGLVGDREASVILSQVRLIDTRRVSNRIGVLDKDTFLKLKSALSQALF